MNRHNYALHLARDIALSGEGVLTAKRTTPVRHGAVILEGKRIVSVGINQRKTHPKIKQHPFLTFMHAEEHAIIRAGFDRCKGCVLCVVRVDNEGNLLQSKPCSVCQELIKTVGIKKIIHS